MTYWIRLATFLMIFQVILICNQSLGQETEKPELWKATEKERTDNYARQLETYLLEWLIEEYPQRAEEAWSRDYSSIDAFYEVSSQTGRGGVVSSNRLCSERQVNSNESPRSCCHLNWMPNG